MFAVRVDTLPAGLVPQLDSLVITGRHDKPPVGGEPESDRAQVVPLSSRQHGRRTPPPRATFLPCQVPDPGNQRGHMPYSILSDPGQVASPVRAGAGTEAPGTARGMDVLTAGAMSIKVARSPPSASLPCSRSPESTSDSENGSAKHNLPTTRWRSWGPTTKCRCDLDTHLLAWPLLFSEA